VIDSGFPFLSHNSYRILCPYLTSRFRCYHSPVHSAGKCEFPAGLPDFVRAAWYFAPARSALVAAQATRETPGGHS